MKVNWCTVAAFCDKKHVALLTILIDEFVDYVTLGGDFEYIICFAKYLNSLRSSYFLEV